MEDYKQKIIITLTKNKNLYRNCNSSKKMIIKNYNQIKTKLLIIKKPSINKLLQKNNKFNNQYNIKNSNSSEKKRKKHISVIQNLSYNLNNSFKKTISLNNSAKNNILKLKNKLFYRFGKDSILKKAHRNKKNNFSFVNTNTNTSKNKVNNKGFKKIMNNISNDKINYFRNSNCSNNISIPNYTNSIFLDLKKCKPYKKKINHVTTDSNFLIFQRNKSLFKSNTYNNLEIICEGINNNINNMKNHINNININCINNKQKKTEISPNEKSNLYKVFEGKKIKKNKTSSYMYLTSINNNCTNILNYNFSKKKICNRKKIKLKTSKNQNKSMNNNDIKSKLNDLKEKMEKLFEENEKNSKSNKYNIIKDKFDESINIMGLNKDEKKFLKLIMNKYNDVISSYSKENMILKKTSEKVQSLNLILDKKYLDLENKYNQNMKLLKKFQKNDNNMNSIQNNNNSNYSNNNYNNNIVKNNKKERNISLLNRLNVNDLNSLYFNDKINVLNCKNSYENYKKVPILKLDKLNDI